MRRGDYDSAIKAITTQIKSQPDKGEHYRFRAELYRLAGKLPAARRDYQKMIALDAAVAVAYNGLAEVELQARNYTAARQAGQKALQLAPDEWVAAYNLGMIEDRLRESEAAARHLRSALAMKMPDSRHRLLAHLYLCRACARLGDTAGAAESLRAMKRERAGLDEWRMIIKQDEAAALRQALSDDIAMARSLIHDEVDLAALASEAG